MINWRPVTKRHFLKLVGTKTMFYQCRSKRYLKLALAYSVIIGSVGCASHPTDVPLDQSTVPSTANRAPNLRDGLVQNGTVFRGSSQTFVDGEVTKSVASPRGYILGGTGNFLNSSISDSSEQINSNSKSVILNFSDMPINDAVNAILGDILGRRFIVEGGLDGTITLQSSRPVEQDALLPILENVLRSKGAAIIDEGSHLRIVSIGNASRQGRISQGQSLPGFGVHVAPLQYVSAPEMARILEPIAPEGSILRVDRSRNMILLSGTQSEISTLVETISIFDVDWLAGMSFGVYPLTTGNPEDVIRDLEALFSNQSETPIEGLVRFLPNTRLNAVIAITPTPSILRHVDTWITKFDDVQAQSKEQLFVYDVQNGTATELAQVLQSVLGGQTTSRQSPSSIAPGLRERAVSSSDVNSESQNVGSSISETFTRSESSTGFELGNGSPLVSGDSISVFPYDSKNSLVVVATPGDYRGLLSILEKLDIVSNQVLIEATIAEVTLRDELSLGLQWFFQDNENQITLSNANNGSVGPVFPGFSYIFSQQDAQIALNALASITDVNVVSSPSLMVLDNQTAVLQVGDEVPVVTQQSVTNSVNTPLFNSISFRDTGVILSVTPRVNDSGLVLLEIEQEVSSVTQTVTSGIDSPTIQQRRIETTVAVNDGESLALGGLIEDGLTRTSSGVPFISSIPLVGNLFKNESDQDERTELLIIITPRVIRNMDEARKVTDEYRSRLNTLISLEDRLDGVR